jgi:hypothetical protein
VQMVAAHCGLESEERQLMVMLTGATSGFQFFAEPKLLLSCRLSQKAMLAS